MKREAEYVYSATLRFSYASESDYHNRKASEATIQIEACTVRGHVNPHVNVHHSVEFSFRPSDDGPLEAHPILVSPEWEEWLGPDTAEERARELDSDKGVWWLEWWIHDEDKIFSWLLPAIDRISLESTGGGAVN
jgi:hypothetical protein